MSIQNSIFCYILSTWFSENYWKKSCNICKYFRVSWFYIFTTIVRSSSIGIQLKKITFYIGKILYLRKRYWIPCTCLPKSFILHVVHLLWIYIYCLQYLNIEHLQTNTYFVEEMLMDTAGEGGKKNPRQLQLSSRSKHPVQFQFHITILEKTKFNLAKKDAKY